MHKANQIVTYAIASGLFPGCAFTLFQGNVGETIYRGNLAPTNTKGKQRHVDSDTLYDIASLTKILAFLGILRLVDQGNFSLDDPVDSVIPFYRNGDIKKMTFRHLLTCGLDFILSEELEKKGIHIKNASGGLAFFDCADLRAALGTMFRYGNFSAFIAGKVLERVMKINLEEALRILVLNDLAMSDTSFYMHPSRLIRVAPTQVINSAYWQYGTVQDPMSRRFLPEHVGIAGLFSSIGDMEKLAWFLATGLTPLNRPLISTVLWKDMTTDQYGGKKVNGQVRRYGLGLDMASDGYVDDIAFCKKGMFMSATSGPFIFACPFWKRDGLPARPVGGVILSNTNRHMSDPAHVHRTFRRNFVGAFLESIKV